MSELPADPQQDAPPPTREQMLLGFLAGHDAACPACGYNLRHLTQPACPECGLSLTLSVGSNEPFKRAWAITLTLSAMVAGVGTLCIVITFFEGMPSFYYSGEAVMYFGSILAVPVPIIMLLARRQFCRLNKGLQNGAVVVSALWFATLIISLLAMLA